MTNLSLTLKSKRRKQNTEKWKLKIESWELKTENWKQRNVHVDIWNWKCEVRKTRFETWNVVS